MVVENQELELTRWRLSEDIENVPRSRFNEDCEGEPDGDCLGVETEKKLKINIKKKFKTILKKYPPDPSESDPNEAARLCILRDWVNLEFIRASRVT